MNIIQTLLEDNLQQYFSQKYPEAGVSNFVFQATNKEHEGDLTLMVFPLIQRIRTRPELLADEIGKVLVTTDYIDTYSVIKGFLNLTLSAKAWNILFSEIPNVHYQTNRKENIVLEYCGPNTNKPLHIGHLRNVFLGYSVGRILEEVGHTVHKVNINNDRGIAICKSMIAYQLHGHGETPKSSGLKGDFLVGKYYIRYNDIYKSEVAEAIQNGKSEKDAEAEAPIAVAAQAMLVQWEEGDPTVIALWKQLNSWFYQGLHETLERLGIYFEKEYYESAEYQKGKDIVEIGYKKGVFQKDESGAIYIDLSDKGLDRKYLQRANGTSIYITQDMALVRQRYEDFHMDRMIYTVGDEQNYHFKVLGYIMEAMNEPFSSAIYHLSYGMVTSKDGSKFKSREGTSADADTIIDDVITEAKNQTLSSGKGHELDVEYLEKLSEILGLGALKYAMLHVHPKKSIPFDPKEAVDLHGDTGTFIQYSYVRTHSILSKADNISSPDIEDYTWSEEEKNIISHLHSYSLILKKAEEGLDPSEITHFALQLAKLFNRFYTQHSILRADDEHTKSIRLYLTQYTSSFLLKSLNLLGIQAPERM